MKQNLKCIIADTRRRDRAHTHTHKHTRGFATSSSTG